MKVFITGITGTLGKELLKRFYHTWNIVGYSRDELKQAQLEIDYPDVDYRIGDVRDYDALFRAMKGADAVIHAAAMKRIEVCEKHPIEAAKTNIWGTENVARAAYNLGISKAVTIGSDKGVEPINVYGMTKALQEKIFAVYDYNCVRYGNVFGSRGSVIPLFRDQASSGKPLTVTNPGMTRFMLTIEDATNLILVALEGPMKGDIFVKRSPAVRLIDVASAFSDNIVVIGKGRGEKLHEMLISSEETTRMSERDNGYVVIGKDAINQEYGKPYTSDVERLLTKEEIKTFIDTWSNLS